MQTVTISINGVEATITLTPEQVKQITEATKPKLFEYKQKDTYLIGIHHVTGKFDGTAKTHLKYGRYRRTKEAAEMDFKRQTRMMRLSTLAWELGECVELIENNAYYVYFDNDEWNIGLATALYPETVFMTEQTAIKVRDMLNSKEYVLDVE